MITSSPCLLTFQSQTLVELSRPIAVGEKLPLCRLLTPQLIPFSTEQLLGSWNLISTAPSLDTSVCSHQGKRIAQEMQALAPQVQVYMITEDLPFAQKRWQQQESCMALPCLSDARDHTFAQKTGLWVEPWGVLARALLIVDPEGRVQWIHIVKEISQEPPYAEALQELKKQIP